MNPFSEQILYPHYRLVITNGVYHCAKCHAKLVQFRGKFGKTLKRVQGDCKAINKFVLLIHVKIMSYPGTTLSFRLVRNLSSRRTPDKRE
jgi:hypothetical protein